MDYEECAKVEYDGKAKDDELILGRSSWLPKEKSLKYAWLDKKGRRARGGELPVATIPQAVLFAAEKKYLTSGQIAEIVTGLEKFS